ncbi:ArsR/SmtB-type metalloregulator TsoR [Desulfonatronospira sp.]|uniref:ArsR/SmtB-type metalloregulator TsoR n=1 Tax=Desulfonatronospira sp. TaxID=1962951 RepID=UPI0025C3FF46|nr:metalloregulator ArsR/SmtB family transcription factor [Desulfonatronospira sp.]
MTDHLNNAQAQDTLNNSAQLAKALGDANRLRILRYLGEERKSVSALVEQLGLSQPLVSHHLRELRRVLLVKVERQGPFVYYSLSDVQVLNLLQDLEQLAQAVLQKRTCL